jgi:hypothetical protein
MAEKRYDDPVQSKDRTSENGLEGLKAMVARAGDRKRGPAPVEKWDPDFSGELDLEIRRDGSWHYQGTPIHRQSLIDLFATVLRKDADGETYLVTPVEKYRILVEDAAFAAVEMNAFERDGKPVLAFRTNTGDVVEAGEAHPLRFEIESDTSGVKPYLLVRGRLEALLTRPVMYELIAEGREIEVDEATMFAIESNDTVFPVMAVDRLEGEGACG